MFKEQIETFKRYRFLLKELVKKGIKLKYRRSYLGILWTLLEPLLTTCVLSLVFGKFFQKGDKSFPVYILTGRLLYTCFSTGTKNAMKSIRQHAGMIKKADGYTSFDEPAEVIERRIRAFIEWPACYSYLDGLQVKFYRAEVLDEAPDGAPGTVSETAKTSYTVNCRSGKLRILEQQLQGKKRMSAGDFMRGHKLVPGDRFGAEEGL